MERLRMPSSVELACVDPAMIENVWPLARPLIRRAIEIHRLDDFELNERLIPAENHLLWRALSGPPLKPHS
jgi:hypothetical protein